MSGLHSGTVRFGDYRFEPETGELSDLRSEGDPAAIQRLAPQPALLLAMLIEARGELVTRETIRERLWPEVEVEFDQGLNFCVRQVRAALGDSASEPRYIETLPRRGYRLLPAVESAEPVPRGPAEDGEPGAVDAGGPRRRWLLPAVLAAALLLSLLALWGLAAVRAPDPPRIGIVPFPNDPATGVTTEAASERILLALTVTAGPRAAVLGPRSTGDFARTPAGLRRMAAELRLDYIVNGRLLPDDPGGQRLLVELIRTSNGAHVWVDSFPIPTAAATIADAAVAGIASTLQLSESATESPAGGVGHTR
jgi:DNA-binding winged helix-turn-helix (wHTH) protein/TolB-like protein